MLSPTRELAIQIAEQFEALGAGIGVKCAVLVGGIDMMAQVGALAGEGGGGCIACMHRRGGGIDMMAQVGTGWGGRGRVHCLHANERRRHRHDGAGLGGGGGGSHLQSNIYLDAAHAVA